MDNWNSSEQRALRAVLASLEEAENVAIRFPNAFDGDLRRAGAAIHLIRFALESNSAEDPEDRALLPKRTQ